jgi:phosphatidate cytidylyltransferase
MLRLRVATAVVGLPIVISILAWGPHWAHLIFFLGCLAVAVAEASRILQPRLDDLFAALEPADEFDAALKAKRQTMSIEARRRQYFVLSAFCVLVAAFIFLAAALLSESTVSGVVIAGLLVAILVGVFATRGIDAEMARVIGFVVSIVYAGLPWIAIWDLNLMGDGARYVFLLLAIVWAGDTGGYFGGRFFGKHKLAPHKSPKKTWEGAFAGLLASIAGAHLLSLFYANLSAPLASSVTLTLAGLFGGMAGQLGDLVESVFKRFAKVKDSGAIFPGHGGFLDRTDGLLFAAPVLWCILIFST